MNVNLEYYRIFSQVARYGNFTKAANALGNSQPNITRAMNLLEAELGCTLFVRTNRGVRLTPEGEQLYERISVAMAEIQKAEAELSDASSLKQGNVTIAASETALNIYLLEILRSFHLSYPGIRLRIMNHSTPQALKALESGEADFAVVTTPVDVRAPLECVHLRSFEEILVGGRTFTALGSQKLSIDEIVRYPFISLGKGTMTNLFYQQFFLKHGIDFKADTEVSTSDQLLPMVCNDLGLAFIPSPMAEEAIEHHEIVRIGISPKPPLRYICLVSDPQHTLNAAARLLMKGILQ